MATPTSTDLTDAEALHLAIFALATLVAPDDDVDEEHAMFSVLDEHGETALNKLVLMREQKLRVEQLRASIFSDEPVPCLCGQCAVADAHV